MEAGMFSSLGFGLYRRIADEPIGNIRIRIVIRIWRRQWTAGAP